MKLTVKILLFLLGSCSIGFAQCKKITADTSVTHTQNGLNNGKIVLELKSTNKDNISINVFGPKKVTLLDAKKTAFDKLPKGRYLIVLAGKRAEDEYCPTSIEVTVN